MILKELRVLSLNRPAICKKVMPREKISSKNLFIFGAFCTTFGDAYRGVIATRLFVTEESALSKRTFAVPSYSPATLVPKSAIFGV